MSDRVCLVTGASRGIGAACVRELAGRGHRVVVNHRDSAADADAVAQDILAAGGAALVMQGDVTDPGDVTRMVDMTVGHWGRLDVLVHNAMTPFPVTSFAELSWEQLGTKLDQEMRAAYLLTHAVLPGMIERRYGRLVYLSTGLSRRPRAGMIALGVAKARVSGPTSSPGPGWRTPRGAGGFPTCSKPRAPRRHRWVGSPGPRTSRGRWPTSPATTAVSPPAVGRRSTAGCSCREPVS